MFLFSHFREIDNLTATKFIPVLNEVVVGTLINDQTTSEHKYLFIQNVIEYLLEKMQSLEVTTLKAIFQIFNSIWSFLPVIRHETCKAMIERVSKNKDYEKYMRAMHKKRMQEYQFYKLYEKMHQYAVEYFGVLKSTMNLGIPVKDELIRGFWFLLNAMQKDTYEELIDDLIETASEVHAKATIGGVLCNVAARDSAQAKKIVDFVLKKLLTKEGDSYELTYHNYSLTELYLSILNSVIYQSSEALRGNIVTIFELLKLLVKDVEKENQRKDTINLVVSTLRSFVEFIVQYKGVISEENLKSDEYLSKLWQNNNQLDTEKIEFSITTLDEKNMDSVIKVLEEMLLPWLKQNVQDVCTKNLLKIFSGILKEIHVNL